MTETATTMKVEVGQEEFLLVWRDGLWVTTLPDGDEMTFDPSRSTSTAAISLEIRRALDPEETARRTRRRDARRRREDADLKWETDMRAKPVVPWDGTPIYMQDGRMDEGRFFWSAEEFLDQMTYEERDPSTVIAFCTALRPIDAHIDLLTTIEEAWLDDIGEGNDTIPGEILSVLAPQIEAWQKVIDTAKPHLWYPVEDARIDMATVKRVPRHGRKRADAT